MSFPINFGKEEEEGQEKGEIPRPPFFDLQEKIVLLLEEMQEAGASCDEKKALFLATLVSHSWSVEEYGRGLLVWLGVVPLEG
jgi:hypothetical protein